MYQLWKQCIKHDCKKILLPISYAPSSKNQFLSIANNPPAMAGVEKVEVGSRSLRAMSLGGNHSQKKFKRQLNPPRRYVDTGSNWKPKFRQQYISKNPFCIRIEIRLKYGH